MLLFLFIFCLDKKKYVYNALLVVAKSVKNFEMESNSPP